LGFCDLQKCLGLLARHLFTELATESVLTSYQPIIMNVDNVRFQKYLLPAIDRSFKRNPELSCVGVAYVSWNMKNWSSKEVVNGFTSVLMPLLKSTDVVIVDNAIKAVNGLLNHLSDSTLQQELLIKFLSYLSGL
jgi:hypothetical protein